MKTAKTYAESSRMAVVEAGSHIDYHGSNPERVAEKFQQRYGVEPIHTEDDESYLIIPCTPEIEQDFCMSDTQMQETCDEMELQMDNFEF